MQIRLLMSRLDIKDNCLMLLGKINNLADMARIHLSR